MDALLTNSFYLEARELHLNYRYNCLEKLVKRIKPLNKPENTKIIALHEAICCVHVHKKYEEAPQYFERALQEKAESEIVKLLLDVDIYGAQARFYKIVNQHDNSLKVAFKAEKLFNHAKDLCKQLRSPDWNINRRLEELEVSMKYLLSGAYMSVGQSRTAKKYIDDVKNICKNIQYHAYLDKIYFADAIYYSRVRSIKKCQRALDMVKSYEVLTGTDRLKRYIKSMEKIIALHKQGVWKYGGKMLVDYDPKQVMSIYQYIQEHRLGNEIDPIFRKKKLM